MFRRFTALFYKYHRLLGLVTGIPMILWTISGISHPLMVHFFANDIPQRYIMPEPLPRESLTRPVGEIVGRAGYQEVRNFRMIRVHGEVYLQVQDMDSRLRYFSAVTGEELPDAENLHAEALARTFLQDFTSPVLELERVESFGGDYAYVNRLLPVMRVRFDRPDKMDIYVETFGERLGTFNDSSRRAYLWFFRNLHSWSFLGERDNPFRITVVVGFSLLTLVVALTGIHLFWYMKRRLGSQISKRRKLVIRAHRWLGIVFSLFLLGFSASALMVAIPKYGKEQDNLRIETPPVPITALETSLERVLQEIQQPVYNLSVVEMDGEYCYQILAGKEGRGSERIYIRTDGSMRLEFGDEQYAAWLAEKVSGLDRTQMEKVELVTRFGSDYPFIMKRLPVYKVSYPAATASGINDWFIETSSSYLSGRTTTLSAANGVGFVMLHKFHFLDFLGKEARDIVLILVTLFLCLVSVLGVLSYWYGRPKR